MQIVNTRLHQCRLYLNRALHGPVFSSWKNCQLFLQSTCSSLWQAAGAMCLQVSSYEKKCAAW